MSITYHKILFFLFLLFSSNLIKAEVNQNIDEIISDRLIIKINNDSIIADSTQPTVKFKRGKAILFTLFTGFLGGHRIYLGTHQRTPIIYSVTLGGLGILPLIDLIHIIFTKDISRFENKSQIIMWGK